MDFKEGKASLLLETESSRGKEWLLFAEKVLQHIDKYCVPQYGDMNLENPELGDQMQAATLEDIQMNMRRYVNRMNSNSRGQTEAIRDLTKIAHYSAILWGKYMRDELLQQKYEDINLKIDQTAPMESIISDLKEMLTSEFSGKSVEDFEFILRKKRDY